MQIRVEHTIDLPADQFFEHIYFNEDFNNHLFQELAFKERAVLEQVDQGDTIFRRVRLVPVRDIPRPFKKALRGASLAFEEQTRFHKLQQRADIVVIPAIKPDKVKVCGTFWIESDAPDRCKRLFEVDVKVNVFAVGPMAEKLILADIVKGHDKAAEVTNRYIRERLQRRLS
jgi:hypothetical protein